MKLNCEARILANFSGDVRYDEMEGKRYLVAPMSMITVGVHNGSEGPLFYPDEELFKTPQIWNAKPVIVYHPAAGQTACDPVILSNRKVGTIMNTRKGKVTVNGKQVPALLAEAWLDEDRMNKVDERISQAIESNTMMELSTGLYTDNEKGEGEWEGEKYTAIARNYRPDHLALLPDLKGACSIEDGAGFLRLNARPEKIKLLCNAMSHGNIRSLLNSWLQDVNEDSWVEDVYESFFIFIKDGKYYKGTYKIVDNSLEVSSTFVEAVRVSEWRTKDGEFIGNENNDTKLRKEDVMNKKKVVDAIIASNLNSWKEANREVLMAMNEDTLKVMGDSDVAAKTAVENAVTEATKVENVITDTVTANTEEKPKTLKEYIDEAPADIGSPLKNMMLQYEQLKTNLIKTLTDNEKCPFTSAQLQLKDIAELKQLIALSTQNMPAGEDVPDYFGQGINNVQTNVQHTETPLVAPAVMAATPA